MTYRDERACLNYDHPDAFDTDLMIAQIEALRCGETVACPVYDFSVHNRSQETLLMVALDMIIRRVEHQLAQGN